MTEVFLKAPNDCLRIDKYDYKCMVEGFLDKGVYQKPSIYCNSSRLPDMFLLLPLKTHDTNTRRPSTIGQELFDGQNVNIIEYPKELKYIGLVDTIYLLKENNLNFWKDFCGNLWKIWDPNAPYNTLIGGEENYLYIYRIYEVDKFFKEGTDFYLEQFRPYPARLTKDLEVNLVRPILKDDEFLELKNKVQEIIERNNILKNKEIVNDTNNLMNYGKNVVEIKSKDNGKYQLKSELKEEQKQTDIKFDKLKSEGKIDFITFHPSYSYEEFIEGITIKDSSITQNLSPYTRKDGFFKELCTKALYGAINPNVQNYSKINTTWRNIYEEYKLKILSNKTKEEIQEWWKNAPRFLLIIDEINRGDISKIFGELITLLESDKRIGQKNELIVKLPYTGNEFGVPPNVYIIGTMNTADRSIALIDVALRRRFGFWEMPPEFDQLRKDFEDFDEDSLLGKSIKKLEDINMQIIKEQTLGKEKEIGHSFFYAVDGKDDSAVISVWLNEIFPLLEEYYYGESDSLTALINNGALVKNEIYKEDKRFTRNIEEIKRWIIGE